MKNTIKTALALTYFLLLTACGFNTNPPDVQPYLNKPMVFSNDMGIQEYSSWALGTHHISFYRLDKNSLKEANNPQNKQWKTVWLGQWTRIIGVAKKGDLYEVDEFYQPQAMSDGSPYAMITVISGSAKGIKGRIIPDDLGSKFKKYFNSQLY